MLPYGALVLERLLEQIAPKDVVFSVFGIREGLLFSMLSPHERQKDPLLSFLRGLRAATCRARSSMRTSHRLVRTPCSRPGPTERQRSGCGNAACLISDIGWRAHPDYRGEQSLNVLAHAVLGGIDHQAASFSRFQFISGIAAPARAAATSCRIGSRQR